MTLNWRLGGVGEPASFTTSAESADYLADVWSRIERMPPGVQRSALIRELTVTMDLFALFQGEFVEPDSEEPLPPPSYLSEGPRQGVSEPLSAPESAEDRQQSLDTRFHVETAQAA